jgi:hypothetical protein
MVKNLIPKLLVLFSLCQGNNSYLINNICVKETNLNTQMRMDGWTTFSRQNCISGKQKNEQEEKFGKHRKILIVLTTQYRSATLTKVMTDIMVRLAL